MIREEGKRGRIRGNTNKRKRDYDIEDETFEKSKRTARIPPKAQNNNDEIGKLLTLEQKTKKIREIKFYISKIRK